MKKIAKPLAISATILYVLGVFFTAWYLISLPERLMKSSKYIGIDAISDITPLHNTLLIVACSTLMLGLIALIAQIISSKNQEANVVYVEKQEQKATTAKLEEDDTQSYDVSALNEELLGAIRQAAASADHSDKKLEKALRALCSQLQASQGAVYVSVLKQEINTLELRAGYALMKPDSQVISYEYGEGLPGQVAKEGQLVNLNTVPDGYIKVLSGLGSSSPKHLLLVPIRINDTVAGVVEIASFNPLLKQQEELVKQSFEILAKVIEESSRQVADTSFNEEAHINEPVIR